MKKNLTLIIFLMGIVFLIAGLILLFFVDQRAQNIFGFWSPFLIITGLTTIAVSFLF